MKEYDEDEFLMLSGIQHFVFCRRQWAFIHIEQVWKDNYLTVAGELMHENAHDKGMTEKRGNTIITRGMPIRSKVLGVSGECDVVEFHRDDKNGIGIFGWEGKYKILPVEYKHGELKEEDVLQLTAEAMCLEEMLCCEITHGCIYYGKIRHREIVEFTQERREKVIKIFEEMHDNFRRGYTPKVKKTKGCNSCSLKDICLPKLEKVRSAKEYIAKALSEEIS